MPIVRHFLDWNRPALPAAADYVIGRYASSTGLDLSRVIFVFPGRRAARRMLELLVQHAADRWPDLIPPRMVTFEQFPELLYPQQRQLADDLTQLLVWKKALTSIPPQELQAALPAIPGDEAVPAWLALCETLRRQHNELAADGLEFDEVFDALVSAGHSAEAQRWKALRRIQSEYLVRMDELELWDRQAARLVAVQQQECRTDCDIILIGTVDMSRLVRLMLDQVADRVTALIHASPACADAFDDYGCLVPEVWQERMLNLPLDLCRIVNSPTEQADRVVTELAALNGEYRADEIAVGMGHVELVPTVLQRLADAGVSGRWPVGMQLRQTRPWRLLNAVAQHLASARDGQPPDFPSLSDLVRHPDLERLISANPVVAAASMSRKRDAPSDHWLTHLDQYLADHLQTAPGALLGKEPRRRVVGAVCDAVDQLLSTLCPVVQDAPGVHRSGSRSPAKRTSPGQKQLRLDDSLELRDQSVATQLLRRLPLRTWAEGCLRCLSLIYQDHELDAERAADRGIVACVQELQAVVTALQHVPPSVMPLVTAAQALQLLLKETGDGTIPPDADESAIDLLGWLELPLDDSPVLILTGFNEGDIPESVTSDVFLPNTFRSSLGLMDNNRRYARDACALTALLHSRKRVVLISGRRDEQGNPLAPSRLWFAAEPESLPERVRLFYGPETSTAQHPPAEQATAHMDERRDVPVPRLSGFIVPRPPDVPDMPSEISVTAFRDHLACPYRSFLHRELHLRSVDDEVRELTASAFGSLMHDVLNRFGRSEVRHAKTAEAIETVLLTELHKLASLRFGRHRSATVTVQLRMLENRLQAFSKWQAREADEGWRIMHTEADLRYEDLVDRKGRPVVLIGRVDRIDQNINSQQWRVLDYKTSESAEKPEVTHRRGGEWIDLQLPLYRLLVRSLGLTDDIRLGYVHLPGDLSRIGCSIADWDRADLESAEQRTREVAAEILDLKIDRVATGDPQRPNEFSRLCQDTVIDRNIPWLADWTGRA